ncbi:MAG: alpha/beta fold hydrolase [Proteobacteria bacterium]|nr:alpha/beta fold hydrolase [Pseudomonadota bacterium]
MSLRDVSEAVGYPEGLNNSNILSNVLSTLGKRRQMLQDCTFAGPDGDFHYIDWGGAGPLMHIAHATGFCARVYTPLVERLRPHLRVLGMDDRGHGKTRAPADPRKLRNWDIFVEDLERFFEHLGGPLIAMGHSRGGVASLLLAIRRPDLVRALILLDPTILPFSWMWLWFLAKETGLARRVPIVAQAARRKSLWPDRKTMLASYREKAPFRAWKDGFLEGYLVDGTEGTGDGMVRLSCKPAWESRCFAVCPHDVWRHIPRLQQPTLVLYGAESDTFLASAAKRFRAKVPSAAFRCLEETGHFVPMERPDESTEAILNFLADQKII